jgi:hypothetical protein
LTKKLRLTIAAAVIGSSLFIGAAPASATCRPEDKVPCETEGLPDLQECSTSFDPGLPTKLGVCDL